MQKINTFDEMQRKIKDYIINLSSKLYMACFIPAKDNDSPENILMWSHYGDSHKGICIKYKVDCGLGIYPINYSNEYPKVEIDVFVDFMFGNEQKLIEYYQKQVATKSIDWQYENEWRLAYTDENNSKNYLIKPIRGDCITAIYLGCENKGFLQYMNDSPLPKHIKVYKGIKSKEGFKINFVELNR